MFPKPSPVYDIAIIGSGPVGMALALAVSKLGLHTVLISPQNLNEPAPKDGRNFALMRGSWRLLDRLGLGHTLMQDAQPITGLSAHNTIDAGLNSILGLPQDTLIGMEDLDDPTPEDKDTAFGYMVAAERLNAALRAAVLQDDAIDHLQASYQTHTTYQAKVAIQLCSSGAVSPQTLDARLIAACDGVGSPVRRTLGIYQEIRDYKTQVFNFDAELSQPHDGLARQVYTKNGPCALLPLSGDRANFAWYVPQSQAAFLARQSKSGLEHEFNIVFAGAFGKVKITSNSPVQYGLKMHISQNIIAPRAALLGTSARHVNPMVGQGLNIGLRDVAGLIAALENAKVLGFDIGSSAVLAGYRRTRWGDGTAWALGIDSLERIFGVRMLGVGLLRGLGIGLSTNAPSVRRFLAKRFVA